LYYIWEGGGGGGNSLGKKIGKRGEKISKRKRVNLIVRYLNVEKGLS